MSRLKQLRNDFIDKIYGIKFYPFQTDISDAIIDTLIDGSGQEFGFAVSRQSGKTTAIVYTVAFLMAVSRDVFNKPIRIAIFGPQREQTKTDFDLLKEAMSKTGGIEVDAEESNSTTFKLSNGSLCYTFPLTETSKIESKTIDLAIFEEANSIEDVQKRKKAEPMTTSTNAPEISVGVAGYQMNYFHKMWHKVQLHDCDKIIQQKQEAYDKTGDDFHLNYAKKVNQKRREWGEDNDEFKTQYKLIWCLGGGQFITRDAFEKLIGDHSRTHHSKDGDFYAGVDTAKSPDSTVVTVVRGDIRPKKLVNWLELRGDNYEDQFEIINDFLSKYNVKAVAIDATGQGDFMPDKFERHTRWSDEFNGLYRVKFSLPTKDIMYKNLRVVCQEFLTKIPKIDTREGERFREQMLQLQREYKGELLSCNHPDSADAHDDYCDSWALAEYAYMKEAQKDEPDIIII